MFLNSIFQKVKLLGVLYIDSNISISLSLNFGHLTPKQADILIKYLEKHPNLELDFSDKYGYMEDHPFAVTTSVFSSLGLSDEFDIKVSHKNLFTTLVFQK